MFGGVRWERRVGQDGADLTCLAERLQHCPGALGSHGRAGSWAGADRLWEQKEPSGTLQGKKEEVEGKRKVAARVQAWE